MNLNHEHNTMTATIQDQNNSLEGHPKQANTLFRFLDLLNPLAVIRRVTVRHLMLGTFLVQVNADVGNLTRQLDFFIPPSGGTVYRYGDNGEQVSIYLDRDVPWAIAQATGGAWLALPSKM